MALVEAYGAEHAADLLALLEGCLDARDVADEARYDLVRRGAVVFLGTLARHLEPGGPKVWPAAPSCAALLLLQAAASISACLPPWVRLREARGYVGCIGWLLLLRFALCFAEFVIYHWWD